MPTRSGQKMKYKLILRLLQLTGTVTYSRRANIAFTMDFRDFEFLFLHKRAHFTQVKNPTRISTITPPTMDVRIRPRYSSSDYIGVKSAHWYTLPSHTVHTYTTRPPARSISSNDPTGIQVVSQIQIDPHLLFCDVLCHHQISQDGILSWYARYIENVVFRAG